MVLLVWLGDLTTDCSGASRRQRSLRSRRLPVGAKGSCQAAKRGTHGEAEGASFAEVKTPMERPQRRMAAALACAAGGMNTMWSASTRPAGLG